MLIQLSIPDFRGPSDRRHNPCTSRAVQLLLCMCLPCAKQCLLNGPALLNSMRQGTQNPADSHQILTNLLLLGVGIILLGLQRLLYGPLRPIEVEQLYEKAWFAITETCLAMTIFREEVGAWFVVMFVSLLIGKIWGWIGEGRVEILEQQPPVNPRLFHARLSTSLLMSFLFDIFLLQYSVQTVRQQARPNMMVMFAFEFAVLMVTSVSTCARYCISLREAAIIKSQTSVRLQERQEQTLRVRQAQRDIEMSGVTPHIADEAAGDDLEDIDVPGWEEKGRWTFYLDLATGTLSVFLSNHD